MNPLELPTFTNGGLIIMIILLGTAVLLLLFEVPPKYRCDACHEDFDTFEQLRRHDMEQSACRKAREGCRCQSSITHHPSCPTRLVAKTRGRAA